MNKLTLEIKNQKMVCLGTGLVALDAVINRNNEESTRFWAGGSCGNVLTILSYLGWESYPIARLCDDKASEELLRDITRWNVNTTLVSRSKSGSTPIIVEKIGANRSGIPWHRFEMVCPNCGSWLPRYKPVLAREVDLICNKMPYSQVFYFDRVSRSSVELAKINKERGALIVFEPSGIKDEKMFMECLQIADIVKYSNERLGRHELTLQINNSLVIETFGEKGLRYRFAINNGTSNWMYMQSYPVEKLRDAAGAGDWCTAGVIHLLGKNGKRGFDNIEQKDIDDALYFGQALASLNCYYEGARGCMYSISKHEFESRINDIMNGSSPATLEQKKNEDNEILKCICPNCVIKASETV